MIGRSPNSPVTPNHLRSQVALANNIVVKGLFNRISP